MFKCLTLNSIVVRTTVCVAYSHVELLYSDVLIHSIIKTYLWYITEKYLYFYSNIKTKY